MNHRSFEAFDSLNIIHVDASDQVLDEVVSLCLGIHADCNRFSQAGELARINQSKGKWVECSQGMLLMLQIAKALFEETRGAYNVALCPLADLWNYKDPLLQKPDSQVITRVQKSCDLSQLELGEDCVRVPVGMRLDLGSIAKGYAAERSAALLAECGVSSGYLNFGGAICVIGPKHDGQPWSFGLQEPYAGYGEEFWALLEASQGSFATSGSYERGATVGGMRVHHVIDPRSGAPVSNGVLEVTVHAGSATMADALSTALFILGVEDGLALANDLDIGALFRCEDDSVVMTEGFPVRLVQGVRKRDDYQIVAFRQAICEEDVASFGADGQ